MTNGNTRSSPPEMSTGHRLGMLLASVYFTLINFIFWVIGAFMRKRVVPEPEDRLLLLSATEAAHMIRRRQLTSTELLEAYIRRIEQVNGTINAIAERNFAEARLEAQKVDNFLEKISEESDDFKKLAETKPLLGVPFTVKDCILATGLHCTSGLVNRKDLIAEKDAVVIKKMKEAGAILMAVTIVPELCMWWESMNCMHGRVRNPYDTRRIVGGSSGGEGALLGAAASVIGIGSDIGGSIRMPSYFNGIFGLKPTPGIISLEGHIPETTGYARQKMLAIGPMCRYAEDLPLLLKVMASEEALESLNLKRVINFRQIRFFYMNGISSSMVEPLSMECSRAHRMAIEHFERKYDVCAVRVDLPFAHKALEFYFASIDTPGEVPLTHRMIDVDTDADCAIELLKMACGKSDHVLPTIYGIYVENRKLFTEERRKTILAQRDRLRKELIDLLRDDALLIFPSFPTPAPLHTQPLLTPFNAAYTFLWNTLALPAIECPIFMETADSTTTDSGTSTAGATDSGDGGSGSGSGSGGGSGGDCLPLGVQLIGTPYSEALLIAAAQDLEKAFGGWKPAKV